MGPRVPRASRTKRFQKLIDFRTSFFIVVFLFLMDFGSPLGSIFSNFSWFLHHFFEHRVCLDFSSILGWILHRFSIIFGCKISSVPEPREPSKLEQVSNESSALLSQGLRFFMIFLSFSVSDFIPNSTYFWTSFFITFGAQN